MEPVDYLRVLQRRWVIVALACLIGMLAGFFTATEKEDRPTTYEATHTISVVQPSINATAAPLITLTPSQLAVYTTVGAVPRRAAQELNFEGTPQELADQITTEADDAVGVLGITATSTDGEYAARLANTFGEQLVTVLVANAREDLRQAIAAAQQEVDDLRQQVAELDVQVALDPEGSSATVARRDALINQYRIAYDELQVVRSQLSTEPPLVALERAVPRTAPEGFQAPQGRVPRMILFGFVGLVLGAGAALVLDRVDTRIRTKDDAERVTGLPVLAEIPHLPRRYRSEIVTITRPASPFAEAYRSLRTTLAFTQPVTEAASTNGANGAQTPARRNREERKVILVTSPGPQEGKTTTVAHLAASYAETGKSVLVLDCDFRRPRLHRVFGTRENPGLSDTLDDPTKFSSDGEVISSTSIAGVRLVPAGTPTKNPARLFGRARVLVDASRRQADVVLVDTPPYLIANDASELIRHVDSAVVVLRTRRTTRHDALAVAEQLERQGAPVVGVVMIGTDEATSTYGGYYYYRADLRSTRPRRFWRRLLPFGRRKMNSVDAPADAQEPDEPVEPAASEVPDGAEHTSANGSDPATAEDEVPTSTS